MTAEVLVMNKHGVAIAADSAATRSIYGRPKIANTANKLFRLSKVAPVGILLYNNSRINDIPFELLVKDFRAKNLKIEFDELSEYADSFLNYLGDNEINTIENEFSYVKNVTMFMVNYLNNELKQYVQKNNITDNSKIIDITKELLKFRLSDIKKMPIYESITNSLIAKIKKKYSDYISEILTTDMNVNKQIVDFLKSICLESLYRDLGVLPYSGVVITGFGRKNYFPSYRQYRLFGILYGKALYKKEKENEINQANSVCIAPFAQRDVVDSFITGIDPIFENSICDLANQLNAKQIIEKIEEEKRKNIDDTIQIVEDLSISDLSQMAKSLVEMTSFKRKVSSDSGTVGGPIDVAVISKGDGFIWVERKHYFKKELNEFFFQGYQER